MTQKFRILTTLIIGTSLCLMTPVLGVNATVSQFGASGYQFTAAGSRMVRVNGLNKTLTISPKVGIYASYAIQYKSKLCKNCAIVVNHWIRDKNTNRTVWSECKRTTVRGTTPPPYGWYKKYKLNNIKLPAANGNYVLEMSVGPSSSPTCPFFGRFHPTRKKQILLNITATMNSGRKVKHDIRNIISIRFLGLNGPSFGRISYRYNDTINHAMAKRLTSNRPLPMLTEFSHLSTNTLTFQGGKIPQIYYRLEFADSKDGPWKRLGNWKKLDTSKSTININESKTKILFSRHQLNDI